MQKLASFEFSHLLPVWYSKEISPGAIREFAVDVGQQKKPVATQNWFHGVERPCPIGHAWIWSA
jgi:hypothetical protein